MYLDLFNSRSVKAQVEAIVDKGADLGVTPIVTHANDRSASVFDELNQLLNTPTVLIARHPVHLVHNQHVLLGRVRTSS